MACGVTLYFAKDIVPSEQRLIFVNVMQSFKEQTYAQNAVASIYLNYRIFDTIFEALMLLVSVIGVVHFSRHEDEQVTSDDIKFQKIKSATNKSSIALVVPAIILLGFYLIINGHNTPGGGFQGGAALSAAFICVYLVRPEKTIRFYSYEKAEKYLFLLILITASGFAASGFYLNYPQYNIIYMIIMNILIGFKVFCGLTIIFYRFVHYEDI